MRRSGRIDGSGQRANPGAPPVGSVPDGRLRGSTRSTPNVSSRLACLGPKRLLGILQGSSLRSLGCCGEWGWPGVIPIAAPSVTCCARVITATVGAEERNDLCAEGCDLL